MSFREKNAAKRAAKRESMRRSKEYYESLAEERRVLAERETYNEYFRAGQGKRIRRKASKVSGRTHSMYEYYYVTLDID